MRQFVQSNTRPIDVKVTLPHPDVPYVLKLDLVDEGICWFDDVGSRPVYVAL